MAIKWNKRQWVIPGVAVAFAALGWISGMVFADPSEQDQIEKALGLGRGSYIEAIRSADVSGDGQTDTVVIYGKKETPEDWYSEAIQVAVIDGKTKAVKVSALEAFSGYEPRIEAIADFTKDGKPEVFIAAATGGSGGYSNYAVINFNQNKPLNLLTADMAEGLKLKGRYLDHFKAAIALEDGSGQFVVDFSGRKDTYVQRGIYDASGRFLGLGQGSEMAVANEIFSYPFGSLEAVDWDGDGVSELRGVQRLIGVDNTERLSEVTSRLSYENGSWQLVEASFSTPIK